MTVEVPSIVASFENEPVLVAASQETWFASCLQQVSGELATIEAKAEECAPELSDDFWYHKDSYMARYRPYDVRDGVLRIPVRGVLLKTLPYATSYATGYPYIWKAFERGVNDPDVKGIAFVVDSAGGAAGGNFDLVDNIYELRDKKPVRAFIEDRCYSAAYSIASVASKGVVISRAGGLGSIGVVTSHIDRSEMLKAAGIKVTLIYAGKRKVDGNPYEALPENVRASIQSRVDQIYSEFVATVARNRGMTEERVRATEAATYGAADSLSEGLADEIGALDDAVAAFAAEVSETQGDDTMSDNQDTPAVDQAAHEQALADARETALTEGATNERNRINAILDCDAAKTRPKAALSAALRTNMTADEASAFLADLSEEVASEPKPTPTPDPKAANPGVGDDRFEAAMTATPNPELAAGDPPDPDAEPSDLDLAQGFGLAGIRPKQAARQQADA